MEIPEKFIEFIGLINESLFYIDDDIVVLEESDLFKLDFSESNIHSAIYFLKERGIIKKSNIFDTLKIKPIPVEYRNKLYILNNSGLAEKAGSEYVKALYVIQLDKEKFFNLYNNINKKSDLGIYYNPITGKGWVKGKIFTFKDHQPEFLLFEKLYKNINTTIKRNEVLNITGTSPNIKMTTFYINDLVKKIRMRTQLNTQELVQNNGNITLVGQKLDDFPNQP